jgi:hypothetical protein
MHPKNYPLLSDLAEFYYNDGPPRTLSQKLTHITNTKYTPPYLVGNRGSHGDEYLDTLCV